MVRLRRPVIRLLPAAGVALAVALVLGTAVGVAVASGGSPDDEPAAFHVPEARMGDRATYDLTLWGDWLYQDKTPGEAFRFLSFEWNGVETIRDADGRMHPTEVLRTSGLAYAPSSIEFDFDSNGGGGIRQGPAWLHDNETAWAEPATTTVVAVGSERAESASGAALVVNGIPLFPSRSSYNVTVRSFNHSNLCLQLPSLQGTTIGAEGRVWLAGCSVSQLMVTHGGLVLRAVGPEQVNGVLALRLDGRSGDDAVSYWFADGIPYPVRMEMTTDVYTNYKMERGRGTFRLDLVGFDRGAEPRQARGELGPAAPEMATTPRQPWGMDDAGTSLPFPPSLAFAKAQEKDKAFAGLLRASPDAYLSTLWYLGSYSFGHEQVTSWWMELTDGDQAVMVVIEQHIPWPGPYVGLGHAPAALATAATYEVRLSHERESRYPVPSALPDEWPTAKAALERWSLYSGKEATDGPAWGHRVLCGDRDCQEADIYLEAGRHVFDAALVRAQPDPTDPVRAFPFDFAWGDLMFGIDGRARFFADTSMSHAGTGVSAAAASPAESADPPRQGEAAPLELRVAGVLPAPQAAGVGLIAILSGIAYWLWPAVKSGGFLGLFSRLRTDRLLEHPQRGRLADLIAAEPGIHFQELGRRSGLANGTLTHHLQKLAEGGHVVAHRSGRYTCYFPRAASPNQRAAAGTTKSEGARAILAAIQRRPNSTMQEIAMTCGLQASTVTYHVQRLSGAGLVTASRDGKYQRLVAVAAA